MTAYDYCVPQAMSFKMICRLKNEVIHRYYEAFYAANGLKGALAACSDVECFG
ncbi:MAG: hypothetical protein IJ706_03210 [Clostridia bacterium]|nr:hypothetical protein [Clostridia bacterium]